MPHGISFKNPSEATSRIHIFAPEDFQIPSRHPGGISRDASSARGFNGTKFEIGIQCGPQCRYTINDWLIDKISVPGTRTGAAVEREYGAEQVEVSAMRKQRKQRFNFVAT